jgi:hypothetical protein
MSNDQCDFSDVFLLDDGMYLHVAKCGLSRVTTTSQPYFRNCSKACDPTYVKPEPSSVGRILHDIIQALSLDLPGCSSCDGRASRMDAWGPGGCRANRDVIIGWLKESAGDVGLVTKALTAVRALGLGIVINPADPYGSLVDAAIERAEALSQQPPGASA